MASGGERVARGHGHTVGAHEVGGWSGVWQADRSGCSPRAAVTRSDPLPMLAPAAAALEGRRGPLPSLLARA